MVDKKLNERILFKADAVSAREEMTVTHYASSYQRSNHDKIAI